MLALVDYGRGQVAMGYASLTDDNLVLGGVGGVQRWVIAIKTNTIMLCLPMKIGVFVFVDCYSYY